MPAGDNNRPNLMASPYLGLRHPVLWKGHQCQRKNEKFSDNFSLRCNCGCAGVKPLSKRRQRVLSWSRRWLKLSQTDISWLFLQIAVGSMSVSMGQWLATSSVPMGFSGTTILTPATSHGKLNVTPEVPKTTFTKLPKGTWFLYIFVLGHNALSRVGWGVSVSTTWFRRRPVLGNWLLSLELWHRERKDQLSFGEYQFKSLTSKSPNSGST